MRKDVRLTEGLQDLVKRNPYGWFEICVPKDLGYDSFKVAWYTLRGSKKIKVRKTHHRGISETFRYRLLEGKKGVLAANLIWAILRDYAPEAKQIAEEIRQYWKKKIAEGERI